MTACCINRNCGATGRNSLRVQKSVHREPLSRRPVSGIFLVLGGVFVAGKANNFIKPYLSCGSGVCW